MLLAELTRPSGVPEQCWRDVRRRFGLHEYTDTCGELTTHPTGLCFAHRRDLADDHDA